MKKILCLIFPFLLFCGCADQSRNIKPVTKGLSFNAEINYYNECYECDVNIAKNGDTEISFTCPKELNGLKIVYSANNTTVDYNGLKYELDSSLPQYSVTDIIKKVFSSEYDTVYTKDDCYYVENKELDCKMYIGSTGLPIKIESDAKFSAIIKNSTLKEKEP